MLLLNFFFGRSSQIVLAKLAQSMLDLCRNQKNIWQAELCQLGITWTSCSTAFVMPDVNLQGTVQCTVQRCSLHCHQYLPTHISVPYTPVTPNCDFTATSGDFKFDLVAGVRCVVAFNRRLAVTPKHRSHRFCVLEIIDVNPARGQRSGPSQKLYCDLRGSTTW